MGHWLYRVHADDSLASQDIDGRSEHTWRPFTGHYLSR
jgi:hypothetical protein